MAGLGTISFERDGHHNTYFFHADKYVYIQWRPGHEDDRIAYGPRDWQTTGKCWQESGFKRVDAALPIPGQVNHTYVFSEDKYCTIFFNPGSNDNGVLGRVHSITEWKSLVKAGFTQINAAMMVPGTTDEAYFFSGNEFCRVRFKPGASSPDELLDGPHMIRDRWEHLGFPRVDRIVPNPEHPDRAYVFYGDQCAQIRFVPGGEVEIWYGPKPTAQYWKSLHQAGFY
ncbi:hemopexin domain protein [Ceratobasidium sp. AG-Ba]|nr:hemopexin domain protein [Ceratobasidium sp. AG-Ba]